MLVILGCKEDEIDNRETFRKVSAYESCMNYVIQVNDDNFRGICLKRIGVQIGLTMTGQMSFEIKYQNVFALKSICDFPETIEEGDTFSFVIDDDKENLCPVCLAYSPVPRKSVSITVTEIIN